MKNLIVTLMIGISAAQLTGGEKEKKAVANSNAAIPAALVGQWQSGSLAAANFYNPSTQQWSEPNGRGIFLIVQANGEYRFGAGEQITTTDYFLYQEGALMINGAAIPDSTRLLSGHPAELPYPDWTPADLQQRNIVTSANPMLTAWAGPWGVSFAANLTPDSSTGIAEWTEETFIRTLRTGKHQGQPNGRDILPPMPWQFVGQRTDEELKAIWAYLRSLPPVKNQVPFPVPPIATPVTAN